MRMTREHTASVKPRRWRIGPRDAVAGGELMDDAEAVSIMGSIGFLITGDEEGPAINGAEKLLRWAYEKGERFDHCIVGEPTSVEVLGDTIKIGRRGCINGTLIIEGRQGHAAYPERADNPIRVSSPQISKLCRSM
jgi:succinyl-diaminopimelate desuccinylase